MTQYSIYEGNMERLEKKLNRIYGKCKKYGCEFSYRQVGEEFKELKDEKGNLSSKIIRVNRLKELDKLLLVWYYACNIKSYGGEKYVKFIK